MQCDLMQLRCADAFIQNNGATCVKWCGWIYGPRWSCKIYLLGLWKRLKQTLATGLVFIWRALTRNIIGIWSPMQTQLMNSIQIILLLPNGSSFITTRSAKPTSKPIIGVPGENQEGQKTSFMFSLLVAEQTLHLSELFGGTWHQPYGPDNDCQHTSSTCTPVRSAIKAILSNVWQVVLPEIQKEATVCMFSMEGKHKRTIGRYSY